MERIPDKLRGTLSRVVARQDARGADPPRTRQEDLTDWARGHLGNRTVVVVSNREPYSHFRDGDSIRVVRNASGLVVALDSVVQALGGVWVAHGNGNAD